MDTAIITALLGLLSVLVSALIWVLKSEWSRSTKREGALEARLTKRDEALGETLRMLGEAVQSFKVFEKQEEDIHRDIISRLDSVASTQIEQASLLREIAKTLERVAEKLDGEHG